MPDWLRADWWAYELTNENCQREYDREYNKRLNGYGKKLKTDEPDEV
jgi:hypothetical protein